MDLNPLDWLKAHANEAEIVAIVAKVKQGIAVAETDFNNAVSWLVGNAPAIVGAASTMMTLVAEAGATGTTNAEVTAGIAAVNAATTALNALVAAHAAGQSNAAAVVSAYKAVQSAVSGVAAAKVSVLS